jgi:phosphoheptose isomerase
MSLAEDYTVKYRFQTVYSQNIETMGVEGDMLRGSGGFSLLNQQVTILHAWQNLDFKELRSKCGYATLGYTIKLPL